MTRKIHVFLLQKIDVLHALGRRIKDTAVIRLDTQRNEIVAFLQKGKEISEILAQFGFYFLKSDLLVKRGNGQSLEIHLVLPQKHIDQSRTNIWSPH